MDFSKYFGGSKENGNKKKKSCGNDIGRFKSSEKRSSDSEDDQHEEEHARCYKIVKRESKAENDISRKFNNIKCSTSSTKVSFNEKKVNDVKVNAPVEYHSIPGLSSLDTCKYNISIIFF